MTDNQSWDQKFHWLYGIEEYLRFENHPDFQRFMKIIEAVLHGNNWAIRDLILQEIQRGDMQLTEQFVNTLMLYHLHDGLPELEHRQMLQYVAHCIDDQFIRDVSSWSIKWGPRANLTDHFSRGQLQSKLWLVQELEKIIDNRNLGTVVMYGGWYATVAAILFKRFKINKYYNLDMDESVIQIADEFNYRQKVSQRFESMISDVNQLSYDADGKCTLPNGITVKPTVVVNTSCEHMNEEWFYNLPDGQFVVLQTNNYFENPQHVNCVHSVDEALEKYKFSQVLYSGEIDAMLYYRYMIIGIK